MRRAVAVGLVAGVLSTLFVIAGAPVAHAEDPLFIDWTSSLPTLTTTYDPSSENDCTAGRSNCIDITIREMQRRFAPLGQSCNHNAVFSLAYLRTTQTYKWARDQEGFFADTPYVNHEDAVFAKFYFDAWDNYYKNNAKGAVPKAWQIAFDAADNKRVTGSGSLFLGMSAHVNRDLPYVLAAIGLTFPDGTSRKVDHDKVNQFLNAVLSPLMAEEAARFDAGIDSARDPMLLGYTSSFQLLAAWRETAWRNAERLVNAPDPAARAQVAQSIEDYAAGVAATLVAADSYNALTTLQDNTAAKRDAYCAANRSEAAPIAYTWGMPTPG
jgi:hypothetical protein